MDFNPRTPRGVRHYRQHTLDHQQGISIHAPREGCDAVKFGHMDIPIKISIHAPREGCDYCPALVMIQVSDFNPRTPRGVRP